MAITSKGEDDERNFPKISPNPVRILKGTTSATFYVKGRAEGRYYIQYQVTENFDYHVKRAESVIMVLDANDGWAGIQFQVLLNISVFGAGLLFFIWRRVFSKVNLPFWNSHPVGLFEKINYENLPPQKFQDKYSVIQGPTLWDRVKKFWKLPCDGNDVVEIAGLDAALSMRLHLDMGHVFLFLSLFSHYMSGREATEKYLSVSFQETTIGNVPLQSPWYWGHVAMTYLTAICVLALLRREVSFPWDVMSHRNLKDLEEQPVDTTLLKGLAVRTAPEPDDINWQNLTYKPRSWKRFFTFFFYQCVTVLILCLFSTPTAVLIYMKLDNNSAMYSFISQNTDSIVAKFLSSYLPSLLLISVNWCLLTSLFYMSIFEPWISESERMQSFLKKGFAYLLLSSVILPSIGVTAVYLASEDGSSLHHGSESAYVEKFMFQLCRNFFIAYVCQRAFLGSILQLLRVGERFIYQPWLRSRAVTEAELLESEKPWPFYFGYDYAIVLSTFMVTLLGVVLSPLLTPFGALYFYMKFFAMKYNLVYVHPRNAGRGRVARSAYTIVFVCLVLFEFTVSVVILEVGRKEQFAAMVVLLCATIGFYLGWWRDLNGNISLSLSALRHLQHQETSQDITRIAVLRQLTENLQKREAFRRLASFMYAMREKDEQRAYLNPYEAGLKVFSCIYAQQKLNSDWQYKKFAFNQLKAHAASFKPKPFLKKKN
ncbi:unnamed protein product [Aphanomyces euteiches]